MQFPMEGFSSSNARTYRLALIVVVIALAVLRTLYLLFVCSFDLVQDEAHYWDWSRNLDWSYYSKGPLVAWLIRGSCELFGPFAQSIQGTEMPAIRFPAVVCGSLLLVAIYILTVQVFHSDRLAFGIVLAVITIPILAVGSLLMTIDAPFTCLWAWALVAGHEALVREKRWAWPVTGLLVGLGILAKYTMGLWLASAAVMVLLTPSLRRFIWHRGVWIMIGTSLLCCIPIFWWNSEHDWITFRHVAGQAGVQSATSRSQPFRWFGPLEYVGVQFGIAMGYWFLIWAAGMFAFRPRHTSTRGTRYLWWMSFPTFVLFGVVTFRNAGQPNWPLAGYLSAIPLGGAWLAGQLSGTPGAYRRWTRIGLGGILVIGIVVTTVIHDIRIVRPLMVKFLDAPTADNPFPLRKIDPTCRLRGWRSLGSEVDKVRRAVAAEEGREPTVASTNWTMPGILGFYTSGHPRVYSFGAAFGDRHSQYDLWHPNPVAEPSEFLGHTFIYVGNDNPMLRAAFEHVDQVRVVEYSEDGQPIARWEIFVCRKFRGFPARAGGHAPRSY